MQPLFYLRIQALYNPSGTTKKYKNIIIEIIKYIH